MKRLFIIFIVLAVSCGTAFPQKKDTYRVRTVVIDPGHGGAKPGAQGSRSQEKAITLSVAKKFGKLIEDNYKDVKVIYTRTTDVDISLAERAHIANRNKADLFISIHANSHPSTAPSGVETFVMGLSESRANLEVAKKENADILLEADYKTNKDYNGFDPNSPESYIIFSMVQNSYLEKSLNLAQAIQTQYRHNIKTINRGVKQAELFVLYKTTCPSVLTEIGFISNPNEEAFMLSDEGQAVIAISLFNAFMSYKAAEEGTSRLTNPVINIPGYKSTEPQQVAQNPEPPKAEPATVVVEQPKPVEPVVAEKAETPATEAPAPDKTEPVSEVKPEIKPVVTPQEKPTPTETLPPVEATAPRQEPVASAPKVLSAPTPTASHPNNFYTVQFYTSPTLLGPNSPELAGISGYEYYKSGGTYSYILGRFASYKEAADFCTEVKNNSRFKDAWATLHKGLVESPVATAVAAPDSIVADAPSAQDTATTETGDYFAVQFLTSAKPLAVGSPQLHGIKDFEQYTKGALYCYSVGHFATIQEASRYCAELQSTTPFKDAWVTRRPAAASAPETVAQTPVAPPATTVQQQSTPKARQAVVYRVQFLSSVQVLKKGNKDLHGITDFRYSKSGRYYIYTCGEYTSLEAARKRCASLKQTTPFKDAFVVGFRNGVRFKVD